MDEKPAVKLGTVTEAERIISPDGEGGDSHARLVEFLEQVHQQMPPIPEEEAEEDIAQAIRAVRTLGQ
ncbi:MAG TPA: hypothetical protein VF707_15615 [Ardenticatenaceae bacterium]|jgi:hypothetical protein